MFWKIYFWILLIFLIILYLYEEVSLLSLSALYDFTWLIPVFLYAYKKRVLNYIFWYAILIIFTVLEINSFFDYFQEIKNDPLLLLFLSPSYITSILSITATYLYTFKFIKNNTHENYSENKTSNKSIF